MAIVQCMSCEKKIIEDKDIAVLECPHCGSGTIKALTFDEEEEGN